MNIFLESSANIIAAQAAGQDDTLRKGFQRIEENNRSAFGQQIKRDAQANYRNGDIRGQSPNKKSSAAYRN